MRPDVDIMMIGFRDKEGTKVKSRKRAAIGIKWRILLCLIAALLWENVVWVYAAENQDGLQAGDVVLLQISIDGEEAVAYLECENEIVSAEAQIAQYPCGDVQVSKAEDLSIHTIFMVDNSLSVTESNRDNIKDILRQYVQTMPEQEVISLAVFGEDIHFLCEKSGDTQEMISLIEEIEFHDQDTYLTDYLYQILEKIENDTMFTRFIVISDGVDNKTLGITKEELSERLKEIPKPIYTIGHMYKDNIAELKNMFALSRATGGKELLIEDFDNIAPIVDQIHDFSKLYACRIQIPGDVMDGSNRHVLVDLHTEKGDLKVTGEVPMPFGHMEQEPEIEEPVAESVEKPEAIPEPAPLVEAKPLKEPENDADQVNDGGTQGVGEKIIIVALVLVIVLAVYLFYRQKRKSKIVKEKKKAVEPVIVQKPKIPEPEEQEDATMMIEGRYLLILRDRMDSSRIFRYPLDNHVIVGRNIDMVQIAVDYSLTVSGQHCEFYVQQNRFFLRDMNSINHTYLNGRRINGASEITSGSIVRLGDVEFDVEIIPI